MAVRDVMAVEPWYPRDWLSSEARAVLTPSGRSAYRDLLDAAWLAGGRLRDDDRVLQGLSGLDRGEWDAVREDVLRYFPVVEGGWRSNPRQVVEYAKAVAYRAGSKKGGENRAATLTPDRRSEIAKAAADARWKPAECLPDACSVLANACTPSPSPTPTPTHKREEETPSESCPQERTAASKKLDLPPFALLWNEKVAGSPLKTIRVWTAKRDRVVKARLAEEGDLGLWGLAMEHLAASPHHRGENDRGWVADVDFLLQAEQYAKWLDLAHGGPPVKADPEVTPQLRRLMGGV
jgi:uncharacterized protein YdaU (DUF1376 family)